MALWDRETSIVEGNRGTSEINICVHLINIRSGLGRDVQLLLSTSDVTASESFITTCHMHNYIPVN